MKITLIAAVDRQLGIGVKGKLPWHIPADLKRFKKLTDGKTVIMGRKTFESLKGPLPGRRNIVMTADKSKVSHPDVTVVTSVMGALEAARGTDVYVIGGGEIYKLFIDFADEIELTHVDTLVEDADAFFPRLSTLRWDTFAINRNVPPHDEYRYYYEKLVVKHLFG